MNERVAVIGAGLMGAQIGAEYALAGYSVTLVTRTEVSAANALGRARQALQFLVDTGLCERSQASASADRLATATEVRPAAEAATVVVESVPEDIELKIGVLKEAAEVAPDAILASNTSSLSIEAIGSALGSGSRTIGTHYWNPPTLMPLVEVISGPNTSKATVEGMVRILRGMGKEPVIVGDIPGFVWNRLQFALLREAVWLVDKGLVGAEAIDLIMERGLARRWTTAGPFATVGLGGQGTFSNVAKLLFPNLACDVDPEAMRRVAIPTAVVLADKRNHRDRALARLLLEDRTAR